MIAKFIAWWKMPKFKFGWMYCIQWCLHLDHLRHAGSLTSDPECPIEGKFMFNPYKTVLDGNKDMIPAIRIGNYIGYYKVIKRYYSPGQGAHSDWAHWDDGLYADLRLVKVKKGD